MAWRAVIGIMGAGVVLLAAGAARAQTGVRNFTENTLQKAMEQRAEQAREAGVDGNQGETRQQAQENKQSAAGKDYDWIERPLTNGAMVRMYVEHPFMQPGSKPKFPALLVVQEWWGVNKDIENRTNEFAAKGYYAIAVDLYDGKVTSDPAQAAKFKSNLSDQQAQVKLKGALSYLMTLADQGIVDRDRIGVIGWCMGGHLALDVATHDPRIKATVLFYGAPITDTKELENLKGPVLGVFGKDDKSIPQQQVDALEKGLADVKVPHEILRYDGAGHAFASPAAEGMGMYRPQQAKDANAKMFAWLNGHLKKEQPAK